MKQLKAYIAGPDVFRANALDHFEQVRALCRNHDIDPLIPLDNEIGNTEGIKLSEVAERIFRGNLAMINDCDIAIANITPFRGPSVDPGTAYEIGAAFALGKPIFYYVSDDEEYNHDFSIRSKEYRDSAFPAIEEFGQIDNLMISRSSLLPNHVFRDLESCLSHVRHSLQKRKAG